MTAATTELKLPSRIEAVDQAATAVADFVNSIGVAEDAVFGIDMAVREAVTNAVLHGNKLNEAKFVELSLKSSPVEFEIRVRDEGVGFNPEAVPDPTQEENLLKTSGRGIFFMRNFMDEVSWSVHPDGGTIVSMKKRI